MRSVGARWEAGSGTPRTEFDFAIDRLDVRIDHIRAQDELVGILFVTRAQRPRCSSLTALSVTPLDMAGC